MTDFQNDIKEWVTIDNKLKNLNLQSKILRQHKKDKEFEIFNYAETNSLQNAIIEITDGKLKFQQYKQTSPLTFKFLENCLSECINNEDQVKSIIKFIKQKRETKYENKISRSYN
jgi:hypothetical protein